MALLNNHTIVVVRPDEPLGSGERCWVARPDSLRQFRPWWNRQRGLYHFATPKADPTKQLAFLIARRI